MSHTAIADGGDDQLYYTKVFLDKALRQKFGIRLDYTATIFQNLNGATGQYRRRAASTGPAPSVPVSLLSRSLQQFIVLTE